MVRTKRTHSQKPGLHRPASIGDAWTVVRDARLHSFGASRPGRPAVVLVPGLSMSGAYFLPLANRLAQEHPVQVVELPGFGRSGGPRGALPMREHAAWLYEWMQARGLGACHLVGHSMGCQVAAHLAAEHPEAVLTLTLIGPTIDSAAYRRPTQIARLFRDLLKEKFGVLLRAGMDVWRAGIVRTWRTSTEMLSDRLEQQLARISTPTLLLRGAGDSIAPESWVRTAAGFLATARWQTIPDGAHCVQFSRPAETARAILDWVAEHESVAQR